MSKTQPKRGTPRTWTARDVALDVLFRVFTQNAFASTALRNAFEQRSLSPADRGLATEIVYGVLRRRGFLDLAIGHVADKRTKDVDPKLIDVLRIGAYQLMYLDRVPDHAVVQAAVDQAKRRRGPKGGGFVNAVLRKLARAPADARLPEVPDRSRDPVGHVAVCGGLPKGISSRLVKDLGDEEALAFALASLDEAPLTLRANQRRTSADAIANEIHGQLGVVDGAVYSTAGGVLPAELLCVREGRATPQDEASMRVVMLLDPQPNERILDVCAAPGGKTTHIAERMDDTGHVVAHDRHPNRLARVATSAKRLGLESIEIQKVLPDETFDRVLVDAPCSGLGTLRRHPEIRWRLTDADIAGLTETQDEVLAAGAERVRVGGVLVYSVCTVTRAEGEAHLAALEDRFDIEQVLRTGPHHEGRPDGFFAAKLVRRR